MMGPVFVPAVAATFRSSPSGVKEAIAGWHWYCLPSCNHRQYASSVVRRGWSVSHPPRHRGGCEVSHEADRRREEIRQATGCSHICQSTSADCTIDVRRGSAMLSCAQCLAASVAVQCISICNAVSSPLWQRGQVEVTPPFLFRLTTEAVG
eukprot:1952144-Rhodomonas_salina.1